MLSSDNASVHAGFQTSISAIASTFKEINTYVSANNYAFINCTGTLDGPLLILSRSDKYITIYGRIRILNFIRNDGSPNPGISIQLNNSIKPFYGQCGYSIELVSGGWSDGKMRMGEIVDIVGHANGLINFTLTETHTIVHSNIALYLIIFPFTLEIS